MDSFSSVPNKLLLTSKFYKVSECDQLQQVWKKKKNMNLEIDSG